MRLKLCLLLSFLFLSIVNTITAQQFDWVTGGGTTSDNAYLDDNPEATKFMCTDGSGNIYALSTIGYGPIYADTFNNAGNNFEVQNFLISSYTCNGTLRWAKFITTSSNQDGCVPTGIVVDSGGHLYVAAYLGNQDLYIGDDTIIAGPQYEPISLMKFDSNGHFDWIRYVGDNSIATQGGSSATNIPVIDGIGNIHYLCYLGDNVPLMNGIISHYGEYDITYNSAGDSIGTTRLDMDSIWAVTTAIIDPLTNKLYTCGEKNIYITGNPNVQLDPAIFAAAFGVNRNLLWMDTIANGTAGFTGLIFDKMGHLYIGGSAQGSYSFNGYPGLTGNTSFLIKTDTSGNPEWIHSIYATVLNTMFGLTLLPNNLIAGAGLFAGYLTDNDDSILSSAGEGQNPFLVVFDTSGVIKSLDQIHGDGFYDWARSITSDKVGNIYIGGQVVDSIWADNNNISIPAYHSVGGNTDFFIMKYGVDCNCTSMPVANYSDTGALTKSFTYTGTTTGLDSVVWDFGDGSATTNSMNPVIHTYDSGSYEACVYAYSACGGDMHCSKITASHSEGIQSIEDLGVSVYPNPTTDNVTIATQSPSISYKLMSITGASLQSGILQMGDNSLSLNNVAPGIYLLQLTDNKGGVKMAKIIKD